MSNITQKVEQECNIIHNCESMELLIQPVKKDLGGFTVRRVLPNLERKMVGPWIFFDHMGPAQFQPGEGINVRPHPHINLATVTYLFEGEVLHRDSIGNVQLIQPGEINLMIAGSGIVHSERERPEVRNTVHNAHGLQLWLALPKEYEEVDPAFYHYSAEELSKLDVEGVLVCVMMGSAYGVTSPVKTYAETLYLEANLAAGQCLELPDIEERAVYVVKGSLKAKATVIPEYSMAIFSKQPGVIVEAREETRIVIVGGEKLDKRYIEWNFVSSRKERIEQAKQDWREGNYPKVPGDEKEFIPLPD